MTQALTIGGLPLIFGFIFLMAAMDKRLHPHFPHPLLNWFLGGRPVNHPDIMETDSQTNSVDGGSSGDFGEKDGN